MDADGIEVPRYFICPISLQIMKDPVTVATGITYDRQNIERWLFADNKQICPLTKEPLSKESELTPNHTLRRLIQAWCTANASQGVDRIPTPRAPINKPTINKLLQDLSVPELESDALRLLSNFASDSESNRRSMMQAAVPEHIVSFLIKSHERNRPQLAEEALSVLAALKPQPEELKSLVADNHCIFHSIAWLLKKETARSNAIVFLKLAFEVASPTVGERLKKEFFREVVSVLKARSSLLTTRAALQVLLAASPMGTNRSKIVEAGAVSEIIELELTVPDKRTSELLLGVLEQLCSCADGRAELVGHAAGIAVVAKRIFRVSSLADDRAVRILSSVCKFSGTNEVLQEMLKVGAVSKLCFVLQANCSTATKEKARWVLRNYSETWRYSPCIAAYLISRYP